MALRRARGGKPKRLSKLVCFLGMASIITALINLYLFTLFTQSSLTSLHGGIFSKPSPVVTNVIQQLMPFLHVCDLFDVRKYYSPSFINNNSNRTILYRFSGERAQGVGQGIRGAEGEISSPISIVLAYNGYLLFLIRIHKLHLLHLEQVLMHFQSCAVESSKCSFMLVHIA